MIYKRIIPVFLLKGKRLVKGTRFAGFIDVGDPLSQAMIYDAQGADEIIVVDIDASADGRVIEGEIIHRMITRCRLPIGVGGGIRSLEDARCCFAAGADKIVVNTAAVLNPSLVRELADEFGAQSVVVSVDVRKNETGDHEIYIRSGTQKAGVGLRDHLATVIAQGAGEILLTSIDREGTLAGFDHALYEKVRQEIPVPLIASGGASCYDDLVALFRRTDCDACGVGKMLFLRDYDIVKFKAYLKGRKVPVRDA